jgi:hypothetical protein
MRKAIAIFFLLLFTASFTEAGQFTKLPLLLKHYNKHQSNDKKLSFASFIEQHYLQDHKSDGDETQDNELPFKTSMLNTAGTAYLPAVPFGVVLASVTLSKAYSLPHPGLFLSGNLLGIFHPPRIV